MRSPTPVRGFFVTGTDTDVGKTYVCRRLVVEFARRAPVTYLKPVQTGCGTSEAGDLIAPDFEYVKSSGVMTGRDAALHVPYRFAPACSPHLAARLAGLPIDTEVVVRALRRLALGDTLVIVEGAGGVLAPIDEKHTMLDLMQRLALPVVLITTPRLGTLNHTMLSARALRDAGLEPRGVVYNNAHGVSHNAVYEDNREFLRTRLAPAAFLELDYQAETSTAVEAFCNEIAQRPVQ